MKDRTDAEAVRREKELAQKLADIVEFGTEADFVAAVKAYRPETGKEELRELICSFALASASGADFVDHFVELLFGLLKFFVSHAFFGLGHNSLEGIHQFVHRGRRFSRLRHYETSIVYLGGKAYCFGRSQSHPSLGYRRDGRGRPFLQRGCSACLFRKYRQDQPLGVANHRQSAPRADLSIG